MIGVEKVWLVPLLPLLAAAMLAFVRTNRLAAHGLAIGALAGSLALSLAAFGQTLGHAGAPQVWNFDWLQIDGGTLRLGFVLDPLAAAMLVMVTFVGLLIFIYSVGYMAHDDNYVRFFCFLSLFASAMLGVVISNSLLLLFMCWEVVGLASYLLIGFWFAKPSAAAAAKKAFLTTRVGDLGLFLGMLWLYRETGTLLFYDGGAGALEDGTLSQLTARGTALGITVASGIALLIFCGAIGKSGQVPLHVWLPDAMEGPTPVSALIHAATMVAAGVFLVARVYPLMDADPLGFPQVSGALSVVTWVGASTALFAASIAVAQTDIKRILAYSTVSQLGFMMAGLGAGGVFVGMFHLITHAFFKALLFLGAGSVIHGAHDEQDILRMGGLRRTMPVTFATYAIGMMALAGVPLAFSGFWSKDEILHATMHWPVSKLPFLMMVLAAMLTAFYMTRQMCYVFFGASRSARPAHESPAIMTVPLAILAGCAVLIGFIGTPLLPWFESHLAGEPTHAAPRELLSGGFWGMLALSTAIVGSGAWLAWRCYGRGPLSAELADDPLRRAWPGPFEVLRNRYYVDELYERSLVRGLAMLATVTERAERTLFAAVGHLCGLATLAVSWISRLFDWFVVDKGFDGSCFGLGWLGGWTRRLQNGSSQNYLRAFGVAVAALVLALWWRHG